MASPTNRQGLQNNPFFRAPKSGGLNIQNPTKNLSQQQVQDWLKQPFRDPLKDLMKQPFRPTSERTLRGVTPRIPLQQYKAMQQHAWDIASRIAKARTLMSRFKNIYQLILDWLFDWFEQWLMSRGAGGQWKLTGNCGSPLPAVGPDTYSWSSGISNGNLANNCTTGQAVQAPFGSIPGTAQTYNVHRQYQLSPARTQIVQVFTRKLPVTAPGWTLPNIWIDHWPRTRPNIPPQLQRHLRPDWPALIDNRIPERPDTPEPPWEDEKKPEEHKEIRFNTDTKTKVQTSYRYRRPTRTREKEQKFVGAPDAVKQIFGWLARNKERLTEIDDFLDTFIDSLPKEVKKAIPKRNGRTTPDLKAKHIYDNWDKIDWNKWVDNFVQNWLEDKAIGTAIALSDKAALKRGASNTLSSRGSWLHNAVGGLKT